MVRLPPSERPAVPGSDRGGTGKRSRGPDDSPRGARGGGVAGRVSCVYGLGWVAWSALSSLSAPNRPNDEQRLPTRAHSIGERRIRRLMGEGRLASEEPQERPALQRAVVANGPAQHGIARLERVQDRALGRRALDL